MKETPKWRTAGHAWAATLYARRPRTAVAPSAAASATPWKSTSPRRGRRRAPMAPAGSSDSWVVELTSRGLRLTRDQPDLLVVERLHLLGQGLEQQLRSRLLAGGDRPVDHLPQLRRLRRRGRDDDVREGADRVGERVALGRVDDRQLAVPGDLLGQRRGCRADAAETRRRVLAVLVEDAREAQLVLERVRDIDIGQSTLGLRHDPGHAGA